MFRKMTILHFIFQDGDTSLFFCGIAILSIVLYVPVDPTDILGAHTLEQERATHAAAKHGCDPALTRETGALRQQNRVAGDA